MDGETCSASQSQGSVKGLAVSCAVLLLLLAPCGVAAAWLVAGNFDSITILAATIAVGVCWLAGCLALASGHWGNRLASPVQGVLGGMFFRMGLPLGVGFLLHRQGGSLAQAGVFYMILGVYLVALVIETLLSLRLMPPVANPKTAISKPA